MAASSELNSNALVHRSFARRPNGRVQRRAQRVRCNLIRTRNSNALGTQQVAAPVRCSAELGGCSGVPAFGLDASVTCGTDQARIFKRVPAHGFIPIEHGVLRWKFRLAHCAFVLLLTTLTRLQHLAEHRFAALVVKQLFREFSTQSPKQGSVAATEFREARSDHSD